MNVFSYLLKNQKGMSLIELTVAAAISVIISMGIVKTNQTGYKGMTKVSTDLDLKMWQSQELMERLSDEGACKYTFNTTNVTAPATITSIKDALNNNLYSVNDEIAGSWTITGFSRDAWTADAGSTTKGTFTLTVDVTRKSKSSFGPKNKKVFVTIVVAKASNPANDLVSCTATTNGSDSLWALDIVNGYMHSGNQNVLIGGAGSDVNAPFQVNTAADEWIPDSGIRKSMNMGGLNQAFTFGSSTRENSAIYGTTLTDVNAVSEDCLVLANGQLGESIPGVEICGSSTHIGSVASKGRVNAATPTRGAVTLGASASHAIGNYSVVTGMRSEASGDNSFAGGIGAFATGDMTFAFGNYVVAGPERGAVALGINLEASGEGSFTLGTNARSYHANSMVLGGGNGEGGSSRGNEFTAKFSNGFRFVTAGSTPFPGRTTTEHANAVNSGVFIDSTGHVGIGHDLMTDADNASYFPDSVKPKLYVKGNTIITGKLIVNGAEVGNSAAAAEETAEQVCPFIAGYKWNSYEKKCVRDNGNSRLILFKLKYSGTTWSVSNTSILDSYDPEDYTAGIPVVIAAQTKLSGGEDGATWRFRIHYNSYYMDSSEFVSALLITRDGAGTYSDRSNFQVNLGNYSGNNELEITKTDDTSVNKFVAGDEVVLVHRSPRL